MASRFSADPAWADVVPVPQDDGPDPVVPIAYSPEFEEVMGYFRAVQAADERSARALDLTEEVIALNAANYTAWHFRRLCLFALGSDLRRELEYCGRVAEQAGSKNYQLWWHRRVVVERINQGGLSAAERDTNARAELRYTEEVLREDAKNYHPWQFRKWVLHEFGAWDGELAYVDALLRNDVRNNSAYAHRFYTVESTGDGFSEAVVSRELAYAEARIAEAPSNESAWNYYRGVLARPAATAQHRAAAAAFATAQSEANPDAVPPVAALVDLDAASESAEARGRARTACAALAERLDPVRAEYWRIRAAQIAE